MKINCGSGTFLKSRPEKQKLAAWLYAQFVTSKTVLLKKTIVGLVEFYRRPARVEWTPTGTNVPDYARLAQWWWRHISEAASGERTPPQALDGLAKDQDAQYWFAAGCA